MDRRAFFSESAWRIVRWSPWLGLIGCRFHAYQHAASVGYAGWITLWGRVIGFVPL